MSFLTRRESKPDVARLLASFRRDADNLVTGLGDLLSREVASMASDGIGEAGRHARELRTLISRNPEKTALLALGAGLLLGCLVGMRERSD